ncbi:C-X-C motif chemokine 2-like [Betta splendens]|uniref:C-X-C motif chemokine 2-like n=1 Tax=Betta splendens TaxID=158456 RepID=A0A9W2XTU8_BETSP|nr:C-X-C motif chemokine 2-like [Betta splendens]
MCHIPTLTLLLVLAVADGLGPGDTTQVFRCRCIKKEKRPIRRYIQTVVVHPANSHCSEVEIIATLKKNGRRICLDPKAPWVTSILQGDKPKQKPLGKKRTRFSTV